jgi:hypothetical protein
MRRNDGIDTHVIDYIINSRARGSAGMRSRGDIHENPPELTLSSFSAN